MPLQLGEHGARRTRSGRRAIGRCFLELLKARDTALGLVDVFAAALYFMQDVLSQEIVVGVLDEIMNGVHHRSES